MLTFPVGGFAAVTLTMTFALTEPDVAVIVAAPAATADTRPALFTVATVVGELLQVALVVISPVVLSL